jgi:hypothetical protein
MDLATGLRVYPVLDVTVTHQSKVCESWVLFRKATRAWKVSPGAARQVDGLVHSVTRLVSGAVASPMLR